MNRIGIVTFPFGVDKMANPSREALEKMIMILSLLSDKVYVVTGHFSAKVKEGGEKVTIYNTCPKKTGLSALDYLVSQISVTITLIKIINSVDIVLLYIGSGAMVLPAIVSRFFGKKLAIICAGSDSKNTKNQKGIIPYFVIRSLEIINNHIANKIVVENSSVVKSNGLERYVKKIIYGGYLYIDPIFFEETPAPISDRIYSAGYFGRFSREKGILNFIQAVKIVSTSDRTNKFLIVGDGPLSKTIHEYITQNDLSPYIDIIPWCAYEHMPKKITTVRTIVVPSYTEGLPRIILEAGACSTPVLATPVGAIPDVIKDGETGFIMEDNSPECIARNINRALNHPNLEQIAQNARALVEREYTYEKAVERWREILEKI